MRTYDWCLPPLSCQRCGYTLYLLFACGDDGLAVFFSQALPNQVIICVDISLLVLDSTDFAATFTHADTKTFACTGLNDVNLLVN